MNFKNSKYLRLSYIAPILVFLFATFSGYLIFRSAWFGIDKHFTLLAESFLKNDLYLSPNNLPSGDFADFRGKQYLFFGPFPSIILMPFVFIFGKNFPQITLSLVSVIITYLCMFFLCRRLEFKKSDSIWLANFFVFGTVLFFVSLINTSAYIIQAVGTAIIMLSILEYFTHRRWFLIGLLVAAAGATRITLFGITIFFLIEVIRTSDKQQLVRYLISLLIPILISASLLGIYNFRRFNSPIDTGYTKNVSVLDKKNYNYIEGWFSLKHIPANLYALFMMPPDPVLKKGVRFVLKWPYLKVNHIGLAIWFTSPLFIYLLLAKKKPYTIPATITIITLILPSLVYFGIGISQYGYRYSLDFLPLLFLILVSAFNKNLPGIAKLIITIGILFNCFYMASVFGSYPLLNIFEYIN